MARELFQSSEVFQQAFSRALSHLDPETADQIMQILYGDDAARNEELHQTEFTQLSLFLIQYALSALWNSLGIVPDYVTGHSIGEYAAACQSGMLELRDAVRLVRLRGQLMGSTPVQGGMAMVQYPELQIRALLEEKALSLSVAAVNSPDQTVVSGTIEELRVFEEMMLARNIVFKKLAVSNAFHSSLMEPVLQQFQEAAEGISFHTARIPLISNIDGKPRHEISSSYLRDHLRSTVRFHDCMSYFAEEKVAIIEIGPGGLIKLARRHIQGDLVWGASLGRESNDWDTLHQSLVMLAGRGIEIDWQGYYSPLKPEYTGAPAYVFNRREYWMEEDRNAAVPETEMTLSSNMLGIMNHHLQTINNQSEYMLKRG
ncbi:Phenolphthiocerol synthesis polyketide synthase type I Pks15/1 [compost metagenome]